jgi:hypothetical protein
LHNFNGLWTIFLELTSSDARHLKVTWQQPVVPLYRELTPVLRNLGWQEGDKYLANPGDQQLRILSRLAPQDFLTHYWLSSPPERLDGVLLDKAEARPEVAGLLTGDKAAGLAAVLHGTSETGPRERQLLIATTDAPARIGASCWQAAVMQVDASVGALGEGIEVLRAAISGAVVNEDNAGGVSATAVGSLLRGAQQALAALPPAPAAQAPPWRDVLAGLNTSGKGDLWLLDPAALEPWQQAALKSQANQQAGGLPELQSGFWQ